MENMKSRWQKTAAGLFRAKLLILLGALAAAVSVYYGLIWIIKVLDGGPAAGAVVWNIVAYCSLAAVFVGTVWFVIALSAFRRAVAAADARSVGLLRAGVLIQLAVSAAAVALRMGQMDPYSLVMLSVTGLLAMAAVCAWAMQLWAYYLLKNSPTFPAGGRRGIAYVFASMVLALVGVIVSCIILLFIHMRAGVLLLLVVLIAGTVLELAGWRCVARSDEPER